MDWESIVKVAGGSGIVGLMLAFALKIVVGELNRERNKTEEERKRTDEERTARIVLIEASATRCAEDRVVLHKNVNDLQAEIRDLYKGLACGTGVIQPKPPAKPTG